MKTIAAMLGALALAGCLTTGDDTPSLKSVCQVLSANADPKKPGPIRYNTFKKLSARFAGSGLAPDLKTRNDIGRQLHCPGFK